ncbi:wall-associated receptor kinase 2-like [Typha latifolia]|uniref:wall-associated receptor kinase 2-like n=1 Tax=Typha latifolia TaxID=4733 RepID=UPI003C2C64B1
MSPPRLAPLLLLLVLLLRTAAAAAAGMMLPGCPASCGNVSIPYPFGIGRGCSRDGFEVTCDGARTALAGTDVEVLSFSLQEAAARVRLPVGWECYNQSGVEDNYSADHNFTRKGVYRLSNSRNLFVVIGCNSLVWFQINLNSDNRSAPYAYDHYTGCLSYCSDEKSVVDGSCAGVGCCQVAIPADVTDYSVYFSGYSHSSDLLVFSPCSYAFAVDKGSFRFSPSDLTMARNSSVPVWLDWAVRDSTCAEAKQDPASYSCRSGNSQCYDSVNGPGYFCNCSLGYQGNPYLVDGCTDIDECLLSDEYPCHGVCINKPGSYDCRCPRGQHGSPRVEPCSPKLSLAAKLAIGTSISTFCIAVFVAVFLITRQLREEYVLIKKNGGLILYEQMLSRNVDTIKVFTKEDIERITENYRLELGRGGHGRVYKGHLNNNTAVAVKKSIVNGENIDNGIDPKEEFVNEMIIMSQINHRNIVRLLGCCIELDVPVLVYEFVSNGTLADYLHNSSSLISLDIRLRLAVESADAIAYLHSYANPPILHGDVKSANILLDDTYTAKVSDFGTSKLFSVNVTQLIADCVQGTRGYLDPEILLSQRITEKSDVYSFGVVLLELITRKKAIYINGSGESTSLAQIFTSAMSSNRLRDMVDDEIAKEEDMNYLEDVAQLAVQCLRPTRAERPKMKEVADRLKKCRESWQLELQQRRRQFREGSVAADNSGEAVLLHH